MARRSGFTLLELIIVIIIVGVLASLALPRFFRMVSRSYSVEAIQILGYTRKAIERCYIMRKTSDTFTGPNMCSPCNCPFGTADVCWRVLGIDNPETLPGAHFKYCRETTYGGSPPSLAFSARLDNDPGNPDGSDKDTFEFKYAFDAPGQSYIRGNPAGVFDGIDITW